MQPINLTAGLAGLYKFEAVNAHSGERRLLADWQPNLITNNGLDLIAKVGPMVRCHVGAGQAAPAVTDVQLQSQVSSTTDAVGSPSTVNGIGGGSPYYMYSRRTWRFNPGQATGNLSEVGIGPNNAANGLFSRSLIRDGQGNPTTITVLADEYLDVTYELRIYAPTSDVLAQVTIGAQVHDIVIRASEVDSATFWNYSGGLAVSAVFGSVNNVSRFYSGPINASATSTPTGTSATVTEPVVATYVDGQHYLQVQYDLGLDVGNFGAGGIQSALFTSTIGCYQMSFSPAIAKDNTKTFRVTFRFHWARAA